MGGSYGAPTPTPTSKVLQAYATYLPSIISATNTQTVPTAQTNLAAQQATAPGSAALETALAQEFGPIMSQITSGIQRQQALSGAGTQLATLQGAGGDTARAASDLSKEINPNYYTVQDPLSTKTADLLKSYDLTGLSPGEAAAIERSTNQGNTATGNLGNINPTNTVANALQFGSAFDAKRAALNTALGTATGAAASAQNMGFNPVGTAFSQPGTTGGTQFNPASATATGASAGQQPFQFGQSMLSGQLGSNNAQTAAAASLAATNSVPSYLNSMPSYS